jgi:hypothetical protein
MTHSTIATLCLLTGLCGAASVAHAAEPAENKTAPETKTPAAPKTPTAPKTPAAPKAAEPTKADAKATAPKTDLKATTKNEPKAESKTPPKSEVKTDAGAEAAKGDAAGTTPSAAADASADQGRPTAVEARMVVKVKSADDARKAILAGVAALGGYASLITDNALDLKVPPEHLPAVLTLISAQGMVLDKTLGRTDLTLDIATLNGQLKSKRAILSELRDLFDGSDVSATLQIERSMNDLVTELEGVKGRLRVATDRARWAVVHVNFDFYSEQRIQYVESQFEWLNSVQLDRFLGEF